MMWAGFFSALERTGGVEGEGKTEEHKRIKSQ